MFQFPGFPAHAYLIQHALHGSSPWGFPHSDIRGSKLICSSPRLIAACHVLHRLPMPRHPPYALLRLNYLRQFVPASLVLALSKNCCVPYLQCFWQNCFFYPLRKNLIFSSGKFPSLPFLHVSLYFVCHVCLTCILLRIHMMILSYSVFNEHPPFRVS